jgi:hypothetical protein
MTTKEHPMKTDAHSSSSPHRPSPAAILMIPVVVAVVLTLFAWPNARLEPRDLPVGVAGEPAAAQAIERQLAAREGAFDVERYADEAAARRAIEDREVYGAFVATPDGPKVLTASAASAAVSQLLTHAAAESGAPGRAATVPVEDVVSGSPRAAALSASVLPLVIAGLLTGVAGAFLTSRGLGRAALVVAGSVLAGLAATAIVQGWLDVVEGDWAVNAAVLSLTVASIAATVAGAAALFGKPGLLVAALTMIFVGNPFSAAGSAPELLPQPVGGIGQLLPPGAGANLLRSTGFFDGAGAGDHLVVLATWTVVGLAALLGAAAARGWRPQAVLAEA